MKMYQTVLTMAAALTLAACASYTKVSSDGTTTEPRWPKAEASTFNKNKGTFPNPESLAQVKSGVTKDQLYYLLGRPHYDEGFAGVHEWNYLFHFNTPGKGTNGVSTCQFKVLFDKNMFARSFYWNPVDPVDGVCPVGAKAAPAVQRYTLNGDALFAFDKSGSNDVLAGGREELNQLANKLKGFDRLNRVTVVGHTDYLGSDAYNMQLSQQRANSIAAYLASRGIPSNVIQARGAGETSPVKNCDAKLPRQQLIACLQPNRRVEIEVDGSGVLK